MKYEVITIKAAKYEGTLYCYEYDESPEMPVESRPAMLVLPGGAYGMCSDREREPAAIEFYRRGYNAYALVYPCAPARYPAQLTVAAAAMDTIRKRAASVKTNPRKVFAVGFSAGGHLCACLANCPPDLDAVKNYDFKPNGVVLSYAVIGKEIGHKGSFDNLLDGKWDKSTEWLDLHNSVRADNPPAFIWATADDEIVPAINSIEYAAAYARLGRKYELHVYRSGPHGMSVADSRVSQISPLSDNPTVANWLNLADVFLKSL